MPVLSGEKWAKNGATYTTVTWSFGDLSYPAYAAKLSGYFDFDDPIGVGYRDLARKAFAAWEAVAAIDFVEVPDGPDVDLRIGDKAIDGVAQAGGSSVLAQTWTWSIGKSFVNVQILFDVDAYTSDETFYSVAVHEIGHAIGLGHSLSPTDVMYAYYNPQNAGGALSADDIAGARQIYGANGGSGPSTPTTPGATPAPGAVGAPPPGAGGGGSGAPATPGVIGAPAPTSVAQYAAAASTIFFLGDVPGEKEFADRTAFAQSQYDYYAGTLGAKNPEIGPYEALGVAFSTLDGFKARYGAALDTAGFIGKAYDEVFHRGPTAAQFQHFNGQIDYYAALYQGAGMSAGDAMLKARGAVAGQMVGFAMTSSWEKVLPAQTLDDQTTAFLRGQITARVATVGQVEADGHDYYGVFL